jgi:cobyrinic acid a,c-diamide synthase
MAAPTCRGVILAAPASGSGKTTVTLGILRALAQSGRRVAAAKVGPDYIDAGYLGAAAGRPCLNLDPWAMRPASLHALLTGLAADAELVVCEGVMGLFDGIGAEGAGSTADLARLTGWPVVLVLDVGGQAASAAALVQGFARHRADIRVAAVLFNRVGSPAHAETLRAAVARHVPEVAVLGSVRRAADLALPSRHLGLHQAVEHPDLTAFLDRAAQAVSVQLDLDGLFALAAPANAWRDTDGQILWPPLGQRIAVARDDAFAFAYAGLLQAWRQASAELLPFSPLADEAPDAAADAVYLPGGYPELHAGRLAGNARFRDGLRRAVDTGAAVFGECGGYMVLGRGLVDADGARHTMAELLPLETSFATPRLHLGYRRMRLLNDGPLGAAGAGFRGHEFHYAMVLDEGDGAPLFACTDALGASRPDAGRVVGRVAGSFMHLIDRETGQSAA